MAEHAEDGSLVLEPCAAPPVARRRKHATGWASRPPGDGHARPLDDEAGGSPSGGGQDSPTVSQERKLLKRLRELHAEEEAARREAAEAGYTASHTLTLQKEIDALRRATKKSSQGSGVLLRTLEERQAAESRLAAIREQSSQEKAAWSHGWVHHRTVAPSAAVLTAGAKTERKLKELSAWSDEQLRRWLQRHGLAKLAAPLAAEGFDGRGLAALYRTVEMCEHESAVGAAYRQLFRERVGASLGPQKTTLSTLLQRSE